MLDEALLCAAYRSCTYVCTSVLRYVSYIDKAILDFSIAYFSQRFLVNLTDFLSCLFDTRPAKTSLGAHYFYGAGLRGALFLRGGFTGRIILRGGF